MAAMSDPHLGWVASFSYHRICMPYIASNFMTRFKDKLLKNLVCRAALATTKDGNIGFDGYIGTWILRIYRWIFLHEYRYIINQQKYFEIHGNTL